MNLNKNMTTDQQQQAAADELRKHLLPDCLKPEYDGMSLWRLAKKILDAADWAGRMEQEPPQSEREAYRQAH